MISSTNTAANTNGGLFGNIAKLFKGKNANASTPAAPNTAVLTGGKRRKSRKARKSRKGRKGRKGTRRH
jgi:hypothetical protein